MMWDELKFAEDVPRNSLISRAFVPTWETDLESMT